MHAEIFVALALCMLHRPMQQITIIVILLFNFHTLYEFRFFDFNC